MCFIGYVGSMWSVGSVGSVGGGLVKFLEGPKRMTYCYRFVGYIFVTRVLLFRPSFWVAFL